MKGMLVAAKVMALTGAELFEQPLLLEQVRKEFEKKSIFISAAPCKENCRERGNVCTKNGYGEEAV